MSAHTRHAQGEAPSLRALCLGALGVVYGDIGTSPIYTMRENFAGAHTFPMDDLHIYGVLSLITWALVIVVTLKYVVLILRADNNGEGGVLALGTLASQTLKKESKRRKIFMFLAICGLALFFGDTLITPAISVLSAVEGLKAAAPVFDHYVVPITLVVLVGLFAIQVRGTGKVGVAFGPVMVMWFLTLGVLGIVQIAKNPDILLALNPSYAIQLIIADPYRVFTGLGVIVLAITGAEALYADMGHFGRTPIRWAWYSLVLPCLLLNYFGQGALLLREPQNIDHLFFAMAPDWFLYPLIGLATAATIIASQAVISGVFSVTRQAVLLGMLPRMTIVHTSATERGQVYIPRLNWILMCGVVLLVLMFQSSSKLAAAYGIAVTGTVMVDSILAACVAVSIWRWKKYQSLLVFGSLLVVDALFFGANVLKIPEGGWFPLVVAVAVLGVILTWMHGRKVLYNKLYRDAVLIKDFMPTVNTYRTISGTAVYLTADLERMPKAMFYNLKYNQVLHERIILLTVKIEDVPWCPRADRVEVTDIGQNFYSVKVHYGFLDRPDVPRALRRCAEQGLDVDPMQVFYFLNRETLIPSRVTEMGPLEERLFMALSTTAQNATNFFRIPPDRVLELGTQVEI